MIIIIIIIIIIIVIIVFKWTLSDSGNGPDEQRRWWNQLAMRWLTRRRVYQSEQIDVAVYQVWVCEFTQSCRVIVCVIESNAGLGPAESSMFCFSLTGLQKNATWCRLSALLIEWLSTCTRTARSLNLAMLTGVFGGFSDDAFHELVLQWAADECAKRKETKWTATTTTTTTATINSHGGDNTTHLIAEERLPSSTRILHRRTKGETIGRNVEEENWRGASNGRIISSLIVMQIWSKLISSREQLWMPLTDLLTKFGVSFSPFFWQSTNWANETQLSFN